MGALSRHIKPPGIIGELGSYFFDKSLNPSSFPFKLLKVFHRKVIHCSKLMALLTELLSQKNVHAITHLDWTDSV